MKPYILDGQLYAPIQKGQPWSLTVRLQGMDFSDFDSLRADFKKAVKLNADPDFSLTLSSGITTAGEDRILTLTKTQTATIKADTLYMDLKGYIGNTLQPVIIYAICPVFETVTNI